MEILFSSFIVSVNQVKETFFVFPHKDKLAHVFKKVSSPHSWEKSIISGYVPRMILPDSSLIWCASKRYLPSKSIRTRIRPARFQPVPGTHWHTFRRIVFPGITMCRLRDNQIVRDRFQTIIREIRISDCNWIEKWKHFRASVNSSWWKFIITKM